jgi:1-acyl-sn-glycerol-3-phosphate acyltransferase
MTKRLGSNDKDMKCGPSVVRYILWMNHALAGVFTYAEFAGFVAAFLPAIAWARITDLGDPTHRKAGRMLRRFGKLTSQITPLWDFEVLGSPPDDIHKQPYVVVANHESTADPFLISWLPWDMRWVGKEELWKLPVLGWMLHLSGDIPVRRGDRESAQKMRRTCLDTLSRGMSIMIFPEGTRSSKGELLPFKNGAFKLALEAQVPILPIAVEGTRACRPKGSMWFGRANAKAHVLKPIPTAGLGIESLDDIRDQARNSIALALGHTSIGEWQPDTSSSHVGDEPSEHPAFA